MKLFSWRKSWFFFSFIIDFFYLYLQYNFYHKFSVVPCFYFMFFIEKLGSHICMNKIKRRNAYLIFKWKRYTFVFCQLTHLVINTLLFKLLNKERIALLHQMKDVLNDNNWIFSMLLMDSNIKDRLVMEKFRYSIKGRIIFNKNIMVLMSWDILDNFVFFIGWMNTLQFSYSVRLVTIFHLSHYS